MALYQPSGSGIGTLLRMIREERSGSPIVSPSTEPGSAIRNLTQEPVYGAESPGGTRQVSIKPEAETPVGQTTTQEDRTLGTSRVGPLAIGGEDVQIPETPMVEEPQYNIPGKSDINSLTGKAYAVNPEGVWDDNYWANVVEPGLKAGTFGLPPEPSVPSKSDINPDTGKPYGVNPDTGVWDDNYFASTVEPQLKAGSFGQKAPAQQAAAPQISTKISGLPELPETPERWIAPAGYVPEGQVLGTQIGGNPVRDYAGPTIEEAFPALMANQVSDLESFMKQQKESREDLEREENRILRRDYPKMYPGQPTPTLYPPKK